MGKLREIERLRGLAILMVVVSHFANRFPDNAPSWLNVVTEARSGVVLFFVISGYVITLSLLRRLPDLSGVSSLSQRVALAGNGLGEFFSSRFHRLFPAAFVTVALVLTLSVVFNQSRVFTSPSLVVGEMVRIFTLQFNYAPGSRLLKFFWTLNVEEHFYLLLPLLFVLSPRKDSRLKLILCLLPLSPLLRWILREPSFATHLYLDGPLLGVLLALVFPPKEGGDFSHPSRFSARAAVVVAVCLIGTMPGVLQTQAFFLTGLTSTAALSAVLVFVAGRDRGDVMPYWGVGTVLEYLGSRSYGLYLLNLPALWIAQEVIVRAARSGWIVRPTPWGRFGMVAAMAAIVLAVLCELLYRLVEQPWRSRRRLLKIEGSKVDVSHDGLVHQTVNAGDENLLERKLARQRP